MAPKHSVTSSNYLSSLDGASPASGQDPAETVSAHVSDAIARGGFLAGSGCGSVSRRSWRRQARNLCSSCMTPGCSAGTSITADVSSSPISRTPRGGPPTGPHGLWVLCPAEAPRDAPQLAGQVFEVLGEHERVVLRQDFVASLRESGAA